jgi:hypothetical protein
MKRWIVYLIVIAAVCPPALAANDAQIVDVQDAGFEAPASKHGAWRLIQHAGVRAYEMTRDTEVFSEGKQSLKIRRTTEQVFGAAKQLISAPKPGKYRYAAKLKTKGVDDRGWAIHVRVYRSTGDWESFFSETLKGDVDWKDVDVRFLAPKDVTAIEIGVSLRGGGTGWIDAVRLERFDLE